MKKLLMLVLLGTFALGLAGCDNTVTPDPDPDPVADTTAPVLTGVENVTIFVDGTFDPLTGVSAIDDVDGDITADIVVTGTADVTSSGVYYLKYSSTDAAGNKTEANRYVTVEVDTSSLGDEMVPNGDFELGDAIWTNTTGLENGNANFTVVDGEMQVEITSVASSVWEPRMENIGIEFVNGVTYEVSFFARALAPRTVNVQVGEILDGAPWFTDFKPGQTEYFDLTTTMTEYSFKFTMNLDTNANGALIFEHGTVVGNVGTDNLVTTVIYDDVMIEVATADPDTAAPVLTGVEDITMETGSSLNLGVVSAFDVAEGAITLGQDNYVITDENDDVVTSLDTSVPGVYTVTFTVSDSVGNEVTDSLTLTIVDLVFVDAGLLVNGDFELALQDPSEWGIYEAEWGDGSPHSQGTVSIMDGALSLVVDYIGDWGPGAWQLQANQLIDVQKGVTYKVTFDAKADAARELNSWVGFQDVALNAWHEYGGDVFALTTEYQEFTYTFTVTEDSGIYDEELKFEFGQATDSVLVDNVMIEKLDKPEMLANGDFENTGWSMWSQDWGTAPVITNGIVAGEYVVTADVLGDANWAIQLFQEGIVLVEGNDYTITFDAKADAARDINFKLIDGNAAEFMYVASLTTDVQTFVYTFTYDGTSTSGKLDFELGQIGLAVGGTITFDNVMFEEHDGTAVVAGTNQVVNGTFDQAVDWSMWAQDWGTVPVITYGVVDGEYFLTTDTLGDANWAIQVFQEGLDLNTGTTYTIEFDMKADAARDINVKLIDGDAVEIANVASLTTDYQTFTYTFIYTGASDTAKLDFEFGLIGTAVGGTINMDNVFVYRNYN